jgi:drug/metabolite transporter (DMT)-like permease
MAHVTALRETSALFGALIGAYVLKESFGARRVVAAAVMVAGLLIMNLGPG